LAKILRCTLYWQQTVCQSNSPLSKNWQWYCPTPNRS